MRVVIIGNGIAGVSAAETIRAADKNSEIVMVSDERYPFYARPRLIDLLSGKASIEQIIIHAQNWYDKNTIRLELSSSVTAIEIASRKVIAASGKEFSYDKLIVAAGASCLMPPVLEIGADTILTLRTINDAEKIKGVALKGGKAVVVGGGLLGIEVANSLLMLGVKVQVLEVFDRLLPRQLDDESSVIIQKVFEKKGMTFLIGRTIRSVERKNGGLRITCSDGKETTADFMVVSAGIQPNLSVIAGTCIKRNRGIVVDDCMRTTVQDIYACGDVAEHQRVINGLWQPCREQGITCGSHILGREVSYKGTVSSIRLKVAGLELASIGEIESRNGIREVVEKDQDAGFFKKYFIRDKKLVGAVLIGNVKEAITLQRMIINEEELHL
ncbi:MAG: FAD-dependent oxidoreductase [Chitinispirillaceae bacterium]|jgi:nitrite reductase (NADH) large subunit